jgi:recombination endonuclease VII
MKRCPECEETLPHSAYGRNKTQPDGLSFYCLACNRARNNRWYREHRRRQGKVVRDHSWVPDGFRWCPACQRAVPHEEYTRNVRTPSGFGSQCKPCKSASDSAAYFYRRYKLTRDAVDAMRTAQDDRCAICGDPAPQHLDHDHSIGAIRQLLCQRCNHGLGLFRDDPAVLRAAAEYVSFHSLSQHLIAACAAAGLGPVRPFRPGEPPVGSDRRPGGRGMTSRSSGRNSRSRRQTQAGEADG